MLNKQKMLEKLNYAQGTLDFFYKFFDEGTAKRLAIETVILRLQEVIDELRKI